MDKQTGKLRKRGIYLCIGASALFMIAMPIHISAQRNAKKISRITVSDKDGEWQQDSQLNIFINQDGTEKIKDGDEGEYHFTVFNDASFTSSYLLTLSETNDYGIPIEYQLHDASANSLAGEEGEWFSADKPVQYEAEMQIGDKDELVLQWRWNDKGSTFDEIDDGATYTIHLQVDAQQIGKDLSEDEEDPSQPGTPDDPQEPGQPDTPDEPQNPNQPGISDDNSQPSQPGDSSTDTSNENHSAGETIQSSQQAGTQHSQSSSQLQSHQNGNDKTQNSGSDEQQNSAKTPEETDRESADKEDSVKESTDKATQVVNNTPADVAMPVIYIGIVLLIVGLGMIIIYKVRVSKNDQDGK